MTKCCLTALRGPGVVVALDPRSELAHDAQRAEAGNGTLRGDQEHAVLCGRHLRARYRVNMNGTIGRKRIYYRAGRLVSRKV